MYLIDTNIISELCSRRPNFGVVRWSQGVSEFLLSAVTVEEVSYGLALQPNARLSSWFDKFFNGPTQILAITKEIAQQSGTLRGALGRSGIARTQADLFIAATAIIHNLTLVTRNVKDFKGLPLTVLNPFRDKSSSI